MTSRAPVVIMASSSTKGRLDSLYPIPRVVRLCVVASIHLAFFSLAYLSAFFIRFDFELPQAMWAPMWQGLLAVLCVKMVVFGALKMYQGWWKYVSLHDVIALAHALAICSVLFMALNVFVFAPSSFPRSIYLLDFFLSLVILAGARASLRLLREAAVNRGHTTRPVNLIIAGAGDTGDMLLREISKNGNLRYRAVAFVDDDPYKQGLRINGVPVAGPISALGELVAKHDVEQVIIAMPSASRQQIRQVVETARAAQVSTKILPAVEAILEQDVSLNRLREVSISDLLGREPVKLDVEAIGRFLKGRTVLITGAGGSIGSELCRQVLRFGPRELVMIDSAETPLFFIHRELDASHPGEATVAYVASVCDSDRMRAVFLRHQPDVIIHAAAYKHVPLMEQNPCEAVKNNVVGTQTMADLAAEFKAASFVLISTDKAVNPTSVMGATKRVTEMYIQKLGVSCPETKFCAVRFGNVLGSNGSVVPIFREQIRQGGPITVTDPQMTRYFMTIPEAVQLVLQAAAFKSGGEVFILDMGEPVKIADLARDMVRLSGMNEEDVPIVYTGMRPGEKLFEELTLADEEVDRTSHAKIFIGKSAICDLEPLMNFYEALIAAAFDAQELDVRRLLKALVPTYSHPDISEALLPIEALEQSVVRHI
ncbi:MAG: polysaccharide biosynthesis protein [Bradymonadaceae bacterium]|nr:polysaccharide biosynthesis protein [Lujinxingiaceae bacterium]